MGEALDRDGRVLGTAEGATKQEVFDKLQAAHADAEEIRIRTDRREQVAVEREQQHHTSVEAAEQLTGEPMLKFFRFAHLPPPLREVSAKFSALAIDLAMNQLRTPERTVALRKLLEAKDAAVRNALP